MFKGKKLVFNVHGILIMGISEYGPRIIYEHSWSDHGRTQCLGMIILMRIQWWNCDHLEKRGEVIIEEESGRRWRSGLFTTM